MTTQTPEDVWCHCDADVPKGLPCKCPCDRELLRLRSQLSRQSAEINRLFASASKVCLEARRMSQEWAEAVNDANKRTELWSNLHRENAKLFDFLKSFPDALRQPISVTQEEEGK